MTIREEIEWCDIRVTAANSPDIPRVLLVGDSITHNYYPTVEERLHGHCAVARLATSKCVCDPSYRGEVQLLLDTYPFSLIHLNNGLHGWGYSEEAYGDSLRVIVRFLREELPQAELILATSTPMRCAGALDELAADTERVRIRNRFVAEIADEFGLPVNDLFSPVIDHPEFYNDDGVHFNAQGNLALGQQVAAVIEQAYSNIGDDNHVYSR